MTDIKIEYLEDGDQGVRLNRIRKDSVVDRIGLKNGDVIKKFNGSSIAGKSGATGTIMQLLKVRGGEELKIKITRGAQTITKTIVVI